MIGGDRGLGAGPFGQGNLLIHNARGIDLSTNGTTLNTITGNLIGTGATGGSVLRNLGSGITITEGAHGNIIGPDNLIAYNGECGVFIQGFDSSGNILTQNSIHNNGGAGICLVEGGNTSLRAPYIFSVDLTRGLVSGTGCANCTIEIFSTHDGEEGTTYEGQVVADSNGAYTFNKGVAFRFDNITSTATDANGNTSGFSRPAGLFDITDDTMLQEDNPFPGFLLLPRPSSHLEPTDTRLGWGLYSSNIWNDFPNLKYLIYDFTDLGVKRLDTSMQEVEPPIDWNRDEFEIYPEYDRFIDDLNDNRIAVNYLLHFWDKDGHASSGGKLPLTPRFKVDEQIQDFLDYVRFVVDHFRGRIQYYTIWSEPDNCGGSQIKCIEPLDYIELARQTIPVIRREDPQAKVVVAPNVLYFDYEYLFTVLRSDVGRMFDVISWHGIYDVTPDNDFYGDYYYEYPKIIEEIKQTASAHGFDGEYWGTELTWCSEEFPTCHAPDQPWELLIRTDKIAAKYDARGFVMHLGMDVGVGWGGLESTAAPWTYPTVRNLNTVMAGTGPTNLDVIVEPEAANIVSYGFTLPNGDILFALWTNDAAVEDDPGINTTLIFPDLSAEKVVGIDVLNGFEQYLIAETDNGDLVIRQLLVRDYPIIIKFIDTTP